MIPIKIQCGCGQKYAFEVEPLRGRMPQRVECPACGADGTSAANQAIAEQLAASSEAVSAPVAIQLSAGPPRPRSNQRRVAAPLLAVAMLLAAAVGVGIYLQKNSIPGAAQANDGLPRTLAELDAWYAEPQEGQNAARLFQSGLDALDFTPEDHSSPHLPWIGRAAVPSLNQKVPVQMKAEIAGLLKRTFSLPPEKLNELVNRSGEAIPSSALSNLPAQQRAYERIMSKVLAARKEPLPARLIMTEQLVAESLAEVRVKKYYLLDELVSLPVFENAARREASSLARLRVAQTVLALEQWRAAHGQRYPDSLDALVPAYLPSISSSPFNDRPIAYSPRGAGYELVCASPGTEKISFTARSGVRGP
jgi:hypothetical protein